MEDITNLLIFLTAGVIFIILEGVILLLAGIFLGAFLGKAGSLETLNFILNFPVILVKSPKKLKTYWKMLKELRDFKKIDLLDKRNQIKSLREELNFKKEESKRLKLQIKRLKWEGYGKRTF